jgi:glycosyltransferase involved in cell wall biosynthesis
MESIASQTFRDIEVIVKDGGSIVLTGFPADDRFRLVCSKDAGIYDAMNQALAMARGDFVHFLNAGDVYYSRDSLGAIASAFDSSNLVGIVYGDYVNQHHGTLTRLPERLTPARLFRGPPCHQACFVKREILQSVGGFDTTFRFVADSDVFVRLVLKHGTLYRHVPQPVVIYQGAGFTAQLATVTKMDREFRQLRARYFTWWQRALFGALDVITLRAARRLIVADEAYASIRPAYFRIAKFVSRSSSPKSIGHSKE